MGDALNNIFLNLVANAIWVVGGIALAYLFKKINFSEFYLKNKEKFLNSNKKIITGQMVRLKKNDNTIKKVAISQPIYLQGSIRLATTVRPVNGFDIVIPFFKKDL